jgi:ligand-binding sensor domain-containing protein
MQEGFIDGIPNEFVQTPDGYLWVATESGLARFDGVRITPFQLLTGQTLSSSEVLSLLAAKDGSLWIGTSNSLEHWKDGVLTKYQSRGRVNSIVQSADDGIWIARSRVRDPDGGLCRVAELKLQCYGEREGIPTTIASALAQATDGAFWISTPSNLIRWRDGHSSSVAVTALQARAGLSGISCLAPSPDGSLWVGIAEAGRGLGLQHVVKDRWEEIVQANFNSNTLRVGTLLLDSRGALWIGTEGQGLYRIYGNVVDHYQAVSGLSSDTVWALFEDREGNIWAGTNKGIDQFRDLSVISFSSEDGLKAGTVESVLAIKDGSVLVGGSGSLDVIREGKISSVNKDNGLPGTAVTSMFEDHQNRLWLAVDNGLFRYSQGKYTPMKSPRVRLSGQLRI